MEQPESEEEDGTVQSEDTVDKEKEHEEEREEQEQEAIDYSYEPENEQPRLQPIKTTRSKRSRPSLSQMRTKSYESNPFDLDRTNTRESFRWEGRSAESRSRAGSVASKARKTSRN